MMFESVKFPTQFYKSVSGGQSGLCDIDEQVHFFNYSRIPGLARPSSHVLGNAHITKKKLACNGTKWFI